MQGKHYNALLKNKKKDIKYHTYEDKFYLVETIETRFVYSSTLFLPSPTPCCRIFVWLFSSAMSLVSLAVLLFLLFIFMLDCLSAQTVCNFFIFH